MCEASQGNNRKWSWSEKNHISLCSECHPTIWEPELKDNKPCPLSFFVCCWLIQLIVSWIFLILMTVTPSSCLFTSVAIRFSIPRVLAVQTEGDYVFPAYQWNLHVGGEPGQKSVQHLHTYICIIYIRGHFVECIHGFQGWCWKNVYVPVTIWRTSADVTSLRYDILIGCTFQDQNSGPQCW